MDALKLISLCHQQAHNAPHDYEDTVFVTLTKRDCWVVALGGLLIEGTLPCLMEETAGLLERLAELLDVQKDHWRERPDASPET